MLRRLWRARGEEALLGVAVPSYLINDGARNNRAQHGSPGSFEDQGVIVDMVGCRFEVPGKMEWRHMIVTQQQNTPANGYGSRSHPAFKSDEQLDLFAALYRTRFPTYEEAREAKARDGSRRWAQADEGRGVPAAALLLCQTQWRYVTRSGSLFAWTAL